MPAQKPGTPLFAATQQFGLTSPINQANPVGPLYDMSQLTASSNETQLNLLHRNLTDMADQINVAQQSMGGPTIYVAFNLNDSTIVQCQPVFIVEGIGDRIIQLATATDPERSQYMGLVADGNVATQRYGKIQYDGRFSASMDAWNVVADSTEGLIQGARYFLSDTPGHITTVEPKPPSRIVTVGIALSSQELLLLPGATNQITPSPVLDDLPYVDELRLTLTSGNPVGVDATSVSSSVLFLTPYTGNHISIWSPSTQEWNFLQTGEVSLGLTGVATNTNFDVFAKLSSTTSVALELSAAWSGNTRTDALTSVDGVLVKAGDTGKRWVGIIHTSGAGTTSGSALRFAGGSFANNKVTFSVGSGPASTQSHYYAAWIRPTAVATTQLIIEFEAFPAGTGTGLGLSPSKLSFFCAGGTINKNSTGNITAGVWTHVMAYYEAEITPATATSNRVKLYINGVLDSTSTACGSFAAGGSLRFGEFNNAGFPDLYTGDLDEPIIGRGSLTDPDAFASALFAGGTGLFGNGSLESIQFGYHCDELTGVTILSYATVNSGTLGSDVTFVTPGKVTVPGNVLVQDNLFQRHLRNGYNKVAKVLRSTTTTNTTLAAFNTPTFVPIGTGISYVTDGVDGSHLIGASVLSGTGVEGVLTVGSSASVQATNATASIISNIGFNSGNNNTFTAQHCEAHLVENQPAGFYERFLLVKPGPNTFALTQNGTYTLAGGVLTESPCTILSGTVFT